MTLGHVSHLSPSRWKMVSVSLCLWKVCFLHFGVSEKVLSCRLPQWLLNGNHSGPLSGSQACSQVCSVVLRHMPRKCKTLGSMPNTEKENLLPCSDFVKFSTHHLSGIWGSLVHATRGRLGNADFSFQWYLKRFKNLNRNENDLPFLYQTLLHLI